MYATLSVLLVFAGIITAQRLGLRLWSAILIGGLSLEFLAGRGIQPTARDTLAAVADPEGWMLILVTMLILFFGKLLSSPSNAEALVAAGRKLGRHGEALSLAAPPAIIGLVPMPAGALVSAPLVAAAGARWDGTPAWKTVVNYWFRHTWEYWWPLYPVVIISLPMFDLSPARFFGTLIWFTPATMLWGYFHLVRPHLHRVAPAKPETSPVRQGVLLIFSSIGLVLLFLLAAPPRLQAILPNTSGSLLKLVAMVPGLLLAILLLAVAGRKNFPPQKWLAVTWRDMDTVFTLAAILVFEHLLEASGLLPRAGKGLAKSGIPLVLLTALFPFLAGLVTGIAVGFAGVGFPIVLGLLQASDTPIQPMAALALAFGFGYAGMMLSPVHLCLVLTRDYFKTSFREVYRVLWPSIAFLMLFTMILSGILQWLAK